MSLLEEHQADQIVIKQLLNEIKRRFHMSTKLIRNDDGAIVRVTSVENITREELVERRDDFQRALKQAEQDLGDYDNLSAVDAGPVASPAEPAQASQEAISVNEPQTVQVIQPPATSIVETEQPPQPPLVLQ